MLQFVALSAPTYTTSGMQTEISAFLAALEDKDWESARVRIDRVVGVRAALIDTGGLDGAQIKLSDPRILEERLVKSREFAEQNNTVGRLGTIRTNFGPRAVW